MSATLLKLENLIKDFESLRAVNDLSIDVFEGEVFGFLGPNGAGKTTTLNIISGMLTPTSGRVLLRGDQIRPGHSSLSRVGVCPQSIVVWPLLTCIEQLTYIGEMYSIPTKEARKRGMALLEALGLAEKANALASKLSGGMQRRLNLLLALVHEPDLVVLDEPEAGLDPQSRVLVREYIQSLARHKTVIFTTHNMDEADRVVDRVAIIDHGKLLALDSPQNLKEQFGHGETVQLEWKSLNDDEIQRLQTATRQFESAVVSSEKVTIKHRQATDILPSILDAVRPICGSPARIQLHENTLEDVFIALTGRELRE